MSLSIDLYSPGSSWLHKLDPRTKLLMAACGVMVLLALRNVALIALMIAIAQLALATARVPWSRVKVIWQISAPTMLFIVILGTILGPHQGPSLLSLWRWDLSVAALANSVATALRIVALALMISLWLFTTDQSRLVRGLVALGLPYVYGLALGMALRFIPAIAASFYAISDAQQARALDLAKGGPVHRVRAYVPIAVAVIITSLRSAENLSRALSSRALGSSPRRTDLVPLVFTRRDVLTALAVVAITAVFAWARWAHGLGAQPLGF